MSFLFVAMGGGIGAMLRYAISLLPCRSNFPFLTLITNLLGAFAIGCVVGVAERKPISSNLILFFKTGICGGFTTFSTFSLEAYTLFKNGYTVLSLIYIVTSVILCFIGIGIGLYISKKQFEF